MHPPKLDRKGLGFLLGVEVDGRLAESGGRRPVVVESLMRPLVVVLVDPAERMGITGFSERSLVFVKPDFFLLAGSDESV